jgi:hypothetical protein
VINPWALLAVVLAWLGSVGYAFNFGRDHEIGAQAREVQARAETFELAQKGAAEAISNIKVQHVEITQPIVREVRTNTVYADCRHTPDGLRAINAAITGRPQPVGGGQLPAASAPGR